MQKANMDIRQRMVDAHVTQWQLAYEIGISSCTMNIWLRTPLSDERRERINRAFTALGK